MSDTSQGVVGVYDVLNQYQKIEEFSGFGDGPHELVVLENDTVAVAVGGIHTRGRTPVNIDTMQPNLSYISREGQLVDSVKLPNHQLSIRHLCRAKDKVIFGQQYAGEPTDVNLPLLASHSHSEGALEFQATQEEWARFDNYIGSVAADEKYVLATSPRGNCYGIWSLQTHELVELAILSDACGVAVVNEAFTISSGAGKVVHDNIAERRRSFVSNIVWDNHWAAI